ncbi:MAG: response regulator [Gammaproteobacteria bacterium]|jgi:two-component system chemotaxis response regulator CheY
MKAANLEQLAVVLVEPSSTQRHIIREFLTVSAIQHLNCVENGGEALHSMEQNKPDLVISAMHLPDMTGVELIETMRSREDLREIAFILISSETAIRYLEPIRQAGAIAILPKPFEYDQLKKALATTLDFIEPEQLELEKYNPGELTVLIVDDSRFSRQHIQKTLRDVGIDKITEAENGTTAMPLLEQNNYDLILTDYNMPEMDGRELIGFIRGHQKYVATPVLMVTSETDMERLAAVDQIGVSAIIGKPFESGLIKKLIQKIMP